MLKLYKFRPIGDRNSFDKAKNIIETGEFYCSSLWEQNDPMEGVYSYLKTSENEAELIDVFSEKNKYRICSFSGQSALERPTMWGYYANGFKGIAIEIEIEANDVRKVKYSNSPVKWDKHPQGTSAADRIRGVITTKLKQWKPECEYRYLFESDIDDGIHCKIGNITGVYFGNAYCGIENSDDIRKNSMSIKKYDGWKSELEAIAKSHKYTCFSAGVVKGNHNWEVRFDPM